MSSEDSKMTPTQQRVGTWDGAHHIASGMSDSSLLEAWLLSKSDSTRLNYRRQALALAAFCADEGARSLRDVTAYHLQQYRAHLVEGPLSNNTLRTRIHVVRSLFAFALSTGHLDRNPAISLRAPEAREPANSRAMTTVQVERLVRGCRPGRDRLLCEVLFRLGLRVDEALHVRGKDIRAGEEGKAMSASVRVIGKGNRERRVPNEPGAGQSCSPSAPSRPRCASRPRTGMCLTFGPSTRCSAGP